MQALAPGYYAIRREKPVVAAKTDDVDLARQIQTGDQSAFRELVERYQHRINRVILGILGSAADAEEVGQEVFAKVYFSIRTFDNRSSLFTWIYRIAVNETYSFLRKKRAQRRYDGGSSGDTPVADLSSLVDGRPNPERAVAQREFLNKLLALIPEDDRNLLFWREVEGCSVAQLAEMTGLNVNTVKVKLFRVRRKLVELAAGL
jgi:RNA polymerase sigma-70 factor (ECF subfamily)